MLRHDPTSYSNPAVAGMLGHDPTSYSNPAAAGMLRHVPTNPAVAGMLWHVPTSFIFKTQQWLACCGMFLRYHFHAATSCIFMLGRCSPCIFSGTSNPNSTLFASLTPTFGVLVFGGVVCTGGSPSDRSLFSYRFTPQITKT